MRTLRAASAAVIVLALSCCTREPLRARGELSIATRFTDARESILQSAQRFPELKASLTPDPTPRTDAILVDYSGSLRQGQEASYSDLTSFRGRLSSAPRMYKGLAGFADGDHRWFLPAAVYVWGLFASASVLQENGIGMPSDLDSLTAACKTLQARGSQAIALSNSHGWPLLGWFLQIDLLRNGADAYAKLLTGERSLRGPDVVQSLTELDRWMSEGYFNQDAASIVWTDALASVEQGKAAFMLMGGFAMGHVSDSRSLSFGLLGERGRQGAPGAVLGAETVLVFPVGGGDLESALAFSDAWILEGAPGLTADGFRVPAAAPDKAAVGRGESLVQSATITALENGTRLLPLLDAVMVDDAAIDLEKAFLSWPTGGFGSEEKIRDFANRIADIAEKTSPLALTR